MKILNHSKSARNGTERCNETCEPIPWLPHCTNRLRRNTAMIRSFLIAFSFISLSSSCLLNADTLVLRSGKVYRGKFVGGAKRYVNFTTNDGHVTFSCNLDEVLRIQFGPDSGEAKDGRPERGTADANTQSSAEEPQNGSDGIAYSVADTARK